LRSSLFGGLLRTHTLLRRAERFALDEPPPHDVSFWSRPNHMEWITRDQSKGWTTGRRKNIRSCRFDHFCRLNFVVVNAFKRCQCYQIAITNSLKLAEKRIPMRRDPDVPIFTGQGSSWDMARGHVQCAVIKRLQV